MSETKDGSGTETSSSGTQMTDAEFAAARERYELGTATLIELADEHDVTRQALSARFKRHGVKKGSRAHEVAAAAAEGAKAAAGASGAASKRFIDVRADLIEETRVTGVSALKQARLIAQKTIIDEMRKPGGTPEAVEGDIRTISRYSKMLQDNIEATLRVLKSDDHIDEEDLPMLIIEDLTDQEILDHHKSTGAMPEDATIEDMLEENSIEIEGID